MNALITEHLRQQDTLDLAMLVEHCIAVAPDTPAADVLDLFLKDRELRVIPVVDHRIPVGLLNRQSIVEMFSRPFRRDLFGRQPVHRFMDTRPIVVKLSTGLDELAQAVVEAGLQQMLDGFLVVGQDGSYIGIGNAQNLLGEMTRRKQEHLYRLAHFDAVTGLPNRILFRDRLEVALAQARRHDGQVAVVFIDIDHFKRINDALGHPVGDALLQAVARRLEQAVRHSDTLARMGGDEFTLVLNDFNSMADVVRVMRKLRDRLHEPVSLNGREIVVTASIGIALYPGDGDDMDELVRKADIALYESKHAGRDTFRFYGQVSDTGGDRRLQLESELRAALRSDQIVPAYQALVDARTGMVIGAEALARWHHPAHGPIPPDTFVALAEDTGLIGSLGRVMTLQTGRHFRALGDLAPERLSLNASVLEIRSENYVDGLLATLQGVGLAPARVQLEITERLFLEPSEHLLDTLSRLRAAGVRIAIDDFGVGSTSLRLLHQLPVDVLKIDRSFVSGSGWDPRRDSLVRAIIDMGHALDLEIVAEGVETEAQARRLRELGCDALQGFLFCRPMAVADFGDWLGQMASDGPLPAQPLGVR
jgi:diguanylate cyclase (GGDEF)-like protein